MCHDFLCIISFNHCDIIDFPHFYEKRKLKFIKIRKLARHQWLTPVILASWEAEIRRITFRSQPSKQITRSYLKKYPTQNRASRLAQGVKHLLSNMGFLS
jgi:hypothetical protein